MPTLPYASRFQAVCRAPLLLVCIAAALSACSTLPKDGPAYRQVQEPRSTNKRVPSFALIDIRPDTIAKLNARPYTRITASFPAAPATAELRIGIGDGLTLYIWEAGTETLFSGSQTRNEGAAPPSARGTQIPEQTVAADGTISVPFAGRVRVAGKTQSEAQTDIEQALVRIASRPQVLVSLSGNARNQVTVIGELVNGARVPLTGGGNRLLDVLASVGGVRAAAYEASISLTRGKSTVSLPMSEVLRRPAENIELQAGDSIVVTRKPLTFSALGATGRAAQIPFDAARVSLIEAVAKAGGISDARADPRGVYLFRFEPQAVAAALGAPVASGQKADTLIPVIYRLDLGEAGSYFLGQAFEMRDRDIIYVASAASNEVLKFLQLLGAATQPLIQGVLVERIAR